ncbi:bacteriochlorophyll 4-vinyl reductase [Rhizobium sp. TH135]|uniref:bacteriochlorophyll 4-vinyl reductase n=1 Tax=Rhizobium sp. TH135 TaxID=2067451 RepID=UPI000C7D2ACC|nr:bacteriochlorophyll 4-vinyl reductase [Rhizobium sp. TH135]PLK71149.1 bacteriochlorophyll 4-vinyl reductase [Rhizobium sp. TH135]
MPTSDSSLARPYDHDVADGVPEARSPARIGPNAIIQTGQALAALFGDETARMIFDRAGIGHRFVDPPGTMLDEREPQRLFAVLCDTLSDQDATRVLAQAGDRTGHYLLVNRIPKPARWLLPRLPTAISERLLSRAISAHAWTFAGSGRFSGQVRGCRRPVVQLAIQNNPLATPGCPWHGAVFERLFATLTATQVSVLHPRCQAKGNDCCEWTITGATGSLQSARMSRRAAADRPDREDRPSQASR